MSTILQHLKETQCEVERDPLMELQIKQTKHLLSSFKPESVTPAGILSNPHMGIMFMGVLVWFADINGATLKANSVFLRPEEFEVLSQARAIIHSIMEKSKQNLDSKSRKLFNYAISCKPTSI